MASSIWGNNPSDIDFSSSSVSSSSADIQSSSSSSSFIENTPRIVQSAVFQTQGVLVNSINFSLSSTPTRNNILIAFLGINQYTEARTPTPPDSTWNVIHNTTYLQSGIWAYWKKVNQGNGQNYNFAISGTNEYHSGVMYEISGAETENPINQHSVVTRASALTAATNSVTPSLLYTLPLAAATTVVGQTNATTLSSLSTGWVAGLTGYSTWEATWSAYKALTTDTTTAISNTFTFNVATMGASVSILLIAPANTMSSSSSSLDSSSTSSSSSLDSSSSSSSYGVSSQSSSSSSS